MDPLSAIGLASSVVQLITFTTDVLSKGREIHKSAAGSLVENVELKTIARTLQSQSRRVALQATERNFPSGTGNQLVGLCETVRRISQDLIDTIEGLETNGSSSSWKSFYQALRSVWKEQEIADCLRRLETHRQQIDSLLLMHLQERLEMFTQDAENRNAQIDQNLDKLLQCVQPESFWQNKLLETAHRSLENASEQDNFSAFLSDGAKQDRDRFLQGRMLESLKFTDMRDRYETIAEAHQKTFDWVFHNNDGDNEPDGTWNNFSDWLKSNKPLYWLTGKPGSGKSTLMKYLSDDPRLMSYMKVWGRDKPICKAKFFLWNSGSALQMSRMGLMRSLLYQGLANFPQEIPRVFPSRWEYFEYFGYGHREFSWIELSVAFQKLVDDDTRNFLFLIDGLDEFDGDCAELASFLLRILDARPNVKMCLASRPWLVFEDAFSRRPSLHMEDLTLTDIELFAKEKLSEHPMFSQLQALNPQGARAIIEEVTQKSTGVFLWVRLVIKSLLEGLRDGDTIEDLEARLMLLPQDLEDLFKKILGDLDAVYFEEASQLFQTVRASHVPWREVNLEAKNHLPSHDGLSQQDRDNSSPLTILSLSFAREDVNRALLEGFGKPMNHDQRLYRAETMRRRLASRCKGLLEVPTFKRDGPEAKVQYLHRTVKDFLHEASAQDFLSAGSTTHFDPHVALCAALIRHTKAISPTEEDESGMQSFEGLVKLFITQCHWIEKSNSYEYARFLDEMDRTTVAILGYNTSSNMDRDLPHWSKRVDSYIGRTTKISSLIDYAFARQLNHYLLAKLQNGFSFTPDGDSYAYLIQRAEEERNETLIGLLESHGIEKRDMERKPGHHLISKSGLPSQEPEISENNPGDDIPRTIRSGVVSPTSETQKQGIFGLRKGINSLLHKIRLNR